jgi:glyoxylase-like metal-dependent hydrolase (beta-lactamase superfamily II)
VSRLVPLRPGLWLVETLVEDFEVRSAVVRGRNRVVIWDTLARPADMGGVAGTAGDLPVSVVYSHGDWDHVWGTGGIGRRWEEVVAHEECGSRFVEEIPGTLAERRASAPEEYDGVTLVPPTRTFRERLDLDLGGVTLELHSLPGHTPDTIVGHLPEWGILLGGDAVEEPLPFLNAGVFLEEWADGLEGWAGTLDQWGRTAKGVDPPRGAAKGVDPVPGAPCGIGSGHPPAPESALAQSSHSPLVIPAHGSIGGTGLLLANARYLRDLAAGREPELPKDLTPFYRDTHAANRGLAGLRG